MYFTVDAKYTYEVLCDVSTAFLALWHSIFLSVLFTVAESRVPVVGDHQCDEFFTRFSASCCPAL